MCIVAVHACYTQVHQQLLYAGVVETTRIRRDGYAIRMKFVDFLRRYSTLGLKCFEVPNLDPTDDEPPATDNELRVACMRVVEAAGCVHEHCLSARVCTHVLILCGGAHRSLLVWRYVGGVRRAQVRFEQLAISNGIQIQN